MPHVPSRSRRITPTLRHVRRALAAATTAATVLAVAPLSLAAQNYVARADSLFQGGRVFAAETLYYYAVRKAPRDPSARLALGRYLAARGALRVGAVLMEEARYFGGNPKEIGSYLAPVYARLGDWKALVGMPGSPLSYAERMRAEWLRDNAPTVAGPDSGSVALAPDSGGFGAVTLVVGTDTLLATVDPRARGLVLDTAWARRNGVKVFMATSDRDWRSYAGVTPVATMAPFTLANVPTQFEAIGDPRRARLGLELLAGLAPTFDPRVRRLALRRAGRVGDGTPGAAVATLTYPGGTWLVLRDGVWPITSVGARGALAGARWTVDGRRGRILIERYEGQ
ncbi:MAG TPA: hypothetical protein VNA89_10425 [Gemmatimonadaceae bacterium]|nr:hypothetical protein [Gemmatimonadaceae bacterium]